MSRPDLDPPHVVVTNLGASAASGFVMLTPSLVPGARGVDEAEAIREGKGQEGLMLLDASGRLAWFTPLDQFATNLRVQTYRGEPVLTYWQGDITGGIGRGEGVILDAAYRKVATVRAGNGTMTDLHDFTLTPQGTALITAYRRRDADLSVLGGPVKGAIEDSLVQEIDVATGKVLFEWRSFDHVGLEESYAKPNGGAPFDYFHINSVSLDDAGHLLVSARNTWGLYGIDRTTGAVSWRLGGKKSDFTMGPGTQFAWQHHATRLADGSISLFDDGATPQVEPASRALVLGVDEGARTVSLLHAYVHPAKLLAPFEGSAQVLADGNMFVGWGAEPYFSEFDPSGALVLDGRLPTNDQSYRAFRYPWVGTPADGPALAVETDKVGGLSAHVSWNGATEVASWEALAGPSPSALAPIGSVPREGFETSMTVHTKAKHLAIAALDSSGRRLGVSRTVSL